MPKMKFNTIAKYNGRYHHALEPFEVDGADVPGLQRQGGVLIEEPPGEADKTPADGDKEAPGAPDTPPKKGKGRRG